MREAFDILQPILVFRKYFEHTFRGMCRTASLRNLASLRVRRAHKTDWFHFECSRLHDPISELRRGHKALVHPFAEIRTKPLTGQLPPKTSLLARFIYQRAGSGELDAHAGIALVIN